MVNETFGLFANALSFGALVGVPITNSLPFQWNQMGIILGEPSIQTYASRAGIFDCRSSFAAGCCKSDRSPCLTGMTSPRGTVFRGRRIPRSSIPRATVFLWVRALSSGHDFSHAECL